MPDIKVGLIGGTGLGDALGEQGAEQANHHELDTPFGRPSSPILETRWADLPVLLLQRHGPGHLLSPSQVPYRANIFALKKLGCTHIIASGAVGSLREEFKPRDLVIADQVIDKTHKRSATFYEHAAVHVEFAQSFCPVLRRILLEVSESNAADHCIHDRGCYICMEGPAFCTRAESLMHRLWGGDLIGMTAMPEAKLAKEAEISYALIALVTDYDSWRPPPANATETDPALLLKEILANLQAASNNAISLMKRAVQHIAQNPDELAACPAQHALKLAIWSDKTRIDPTEVQRLAPLWIKYFG
jgi:5'-methylthioadenosine phosphorylase